MARKAEDRPVAIQQPKQTQQQPRQTATVRVPGYLGQDPARAHFAKLVESDIEASITKLEELWIPSNVSEKKQNERLADTTAILVQMDAQTKNLVNYLDDYSGLCRAYVSLHALFSMELFPGVPLHMFKAFAYFVRNTADMDTTISGEE